MYNLYIIDEVESFEDGTDIVSRIKELQNNKNIRNQFVVIEKDKSFLEVCIGLEDSSVLIYTPASEEESKISCNDSIGRAKGEEIILKSYDGEEMTLSNSNIIALEDAYKIVEAFTTGDDFMNIIDWYTF